MPHFSSRSNRRLRSCDERLQKIFKYVVTYFDCSILEGHRNEEKQNKAFDTGVSQLKWPNGKHNKEPSEAVDVLPYPINWGDLKRMYYFAGFVMATAQAMNIPLRWGGDWNRDTEIMDNRFNDLAHFELI